MKPGRGGGRLQGHRARKRFGQHFLTDDALIGRMLDVINPVSGEHVIEIGPGLGALTDGLVERTGNLTAVELDRDLIARLRKRYQADQLEIVEADALRVDWRGLTAPGQARLIGNLPYNISSPLLVLLIDCFDLVTDQHFMLQREVVDRIVASEGSAYGRLGILLQAFYECESILDVPASAFDPPPRVESAVVRMRSRDKALVPDAADLSRLLAVAFGQRRKMLRGTLLPWLAGNGIEDVDIEPTARPENIPAADYFALATRLSAMR